MGSGLLKEYQLLTPLLIEEYLIIVITLIQLIRTLMNQVDPSSNIPATRKITIRLVISVVLAIFGAVVTQNFYEVTESYYREDKCKTA